MALALASPEWLPGYLQLARAGKLKARVRDAQAALSHCALCPRACGVDRRQGQLGFCQAGEQVRVASWNVHHWEEPPISGTRGSGTIFLSHCTARCIFCQNYPISQLGVGQDVTPQRLAGMMLDLQGSGCHNINLVTPTHYVPQILEALNVAAERGLHVPLLYNTSGYDTVETLQLLDGIVDIYLPDAKYAEDSVAQRLSGYRGYVAHNRSALLEMRRQVGSELQLNAEGIARRGMVVRHLVLPNGLSQTPEVLAWLATHLGKDTYISLMSQYFPAYQAVGHAELGRPLSSDEYVQALDALDQLGLANGWRQEMTDECAG